jgi:hypothetical protein
LLQKLALCLIQSCDHHLLLMVLKLPTLAMILKSRPEA